jgi:hypothetical protein
MVNPGTPSGKIDPSPWEEASLQSTAYTFE